MYSCGRCQKSFRDNYNLSVHLSRKFPCKNVQCTEKEGDRQDSTAEMLESTPNKLDYTVQEQKNTQQVLNSTCKECEFCLKKFSLKSNIKKHKSVCSYKNDPIRIMEMEQGIKPELPNNKLECRFCNLIFSRTDSLNRHTSTCKEREKYITSLQKQPNQNANIINNNITNNNNCTFNDNRTINITIGNEDKSHITLECLFESFKQILDECPDDQTRQIALKLICTYDKKLKELPENKTMKIPNLNSMIAYIKQETGWEMVPIDDGIHKVLKNSATGIIKHRTEMEALGKKNRLTFHGTNVQMTPQIMDEVNHIKKNGIYTEQLSGSTKTAIKITNLEN